MPTPSFDELLTRAREIADQNDQAQRPHTGELIAKGLSGFVSNLMNTQVSERRSTGGYISPKGQFTALKEPYQSGGNLMQVLADYAMNGQKGQSPVPEGSYALSPEQSADFGMKSALQNQKYDALTNIANIRAKAMRAGGGKISTTIQPMKKEASDYIWALVGRDPESETALPLLTYGEADRLLRSKGIDTNTELKSIGYDISLNKDPLFGVPPAERTRIQGNIADQGKSTAFTGTPSFKTMKDAQAAFNAGKIKKGQKIKVGGVEDVVN